MNPNDGRIDSFGNKINPDLFINISIKIFYKMSEILKSQSNLNVLVAASFILLTMFLSFILKLHLAVDLAIAAVRCALQLLLLGSILVPVFESSSIYIVMALALGMMIVTVLELYNKTKKAHSWMFATSFFSLAVSCFGVGIIGNWICLSTDTDPWYTARSFIPTYSMLLGRDMIIINNDLLVIIIIIMVRKHAEWYCCGHQLFYIANILWW